MGVPSRMTLVLACVFVVFSERLSALANPNMDCFRSVLNASKASLSCVTGVPCKLSSIHCLASTASFCFVGANLPWRFSPIKSLNASSINLSLGILGCCPLPCLISSTVASPSATSAAILNSATSRPSLGIPFLLKYRLTARSCRVKSSALVSNSLCILAELSVLNLLILRSASA